MTSAETIVRRDAEASVGALDTDAMSTDADNTDPVKYAKAILNILDDAGDEKARQGENQRAMLNILEDLESEKTRLESTQKALINMLDDLEAERRAIDKANLDLRDVNEAMRSFIATAAHDLRSPLASMVGFSSLLTESWETLDDEKRLKFVTTIDRQSHKLTWLVNDLLTLSSIEGGVLTTQPERVMLAEAIDQSVAASRTDAAQVSVSCAPDIAAWVDPLHLERIIDNYLQNAFKYGKPPIRVEVVPLGDTVEIRVVDHGLGVPADFEPKLFTKFVRADVPTTRDKKGTGLGLSIVRGLAQANGGQAYYQPHTPQGSCFIVLLPTRSTEERSHR